MLLVIIRYHLLIIITHTVLAFGTNTVCLSSSEPLPLCPESLCVGSDYFNLKFSYYLHDWLPLGDIAFFTP